MTTSQEPPFAPPFFIVGCVTSGAKMLRNLLRRHPNLACPEETHFYRFAEPFGTEGFNRRVSANRTLTKHRAIDGVTEAEFAELLAASTSRADLYDRYMRIFVRRRKPTATRWFDETPENVFGAAMAASELRHATFVHVVRDPVAVVARLRNAERTSVSVACSRWNESVAICATLAEAYPERLLEMRYEDLLADPLRSVSRALDFIGESFDPRMFRNVAARGIDRRDAGGLDEADVARIEKACAFGRARYGYARGGAGASAEHATSPASTAAVTVAVTGVAAAPDEVRAFESRSRAESRSIRVAAIDEIGTAVVRAELQASETYSRRPPTRTHLGVPSAVAHERRMRETAASVPAQRLFELDVVVSGRGTMLVGQDLVRENLEGAPVARLVHALGRSLPIPERTIEQPTIYTTRYGVLNYGHGLTDILPRIVLASRAMPDCAIAVHPGLPSSVRTALEASGVDPSRLVVLDDSPTRLVRGLYPTPCSFHPLLHSPRSISLVRELGSVLGADEHSPFGERLFVTRADARTRRVANQPEVAEFLAARGFRAVSLGNEDLGTQIRAFAGAREIVGISGAAMTNIVFSRPGTKVTILSPSTMPSLYFWDLAGHCGHDFRIGYFEATTPERKIHSDFEVDVEALRGLLDP